MAKRKTKTRAKPGAKSKAKARPPAVARTKNRSRSAKKPLHRGVSYWSFPGGMDNRADVISTLSRSRELGFSALELGISDTGVLTLETSRSECRALARAAEAADVRFSSLATNLYLSLIHI